MTFVRLDVYRSRILSRSRRNKLVRSLPGNNAVPVTLRMMESTRRALDVEASRRGLTVSDLVAEALAVRPVGPIALDPHATELLRRGVS